jgi:cysteine-rich repeat protein
MWGTMHQTLRVLALVAVAACGDNYEGNTAPTIQGLTLTTDEDMSITRSLDIADNEGDPVTLTFTQPAHGLASTAGADTFAYLPEPDYNGRDSFVVTVSDGKAQSSATIDITIIGTNDKPKGSPDTFATTEDTPLSTPTSALLANDIDIDGDPLTIVSLGQSTNGFASLVNNVVTFTPSFDFEGAASYQYVVSDGHESSSVLVTINITGVNDAPFAQNDFLTTAEDTPLVIQGSTLAGNDFDPENQLLTVTGVTGATNGTVALVGTTITFTPTANFSGNGQFTYTVSDGALTDTGTVFISIGAANDPPVAVADSVATNEDIAVVVTQATMIANDTDSDIGTTLTVTGAATPVNGTLAFAGGNVTFTPTANFNGTGGFQYTLSDGTATTTGTVTVAIAPVNDPPVAIDDVVTISEDAVASITTLTANDQDIDGNPLSIQSVGNASIGTVTRAGTTVTFTPPANFAGTATFDYVVSDGTLTDSGTVMVVVTAVNDTPVASDDAVTLAEDTPLVLAGSTLVANDTDIETPAALTVAAAGGATNGAVSLAGGNVTFTPTVDFHGTASFTYTVSDGSATDTGLVTITVTPVNDLPVAGADNVTAPAGTPTDFTAAQFLANDTDADLDTLSITAVDNPSDGATVTLAGTTITYTAPIIFSGVGTFQYTVSDGNGGTATGTVSVGVNVTNVCGDGTLAGAETCDDGGTTPGDGCSPTCTVEPGYTCTGQPSSCTPTCGDGIAIGTETCDDGGTSPGDGCSATCTVEPGYTCTGQPSACTTFCGDGITAGDEDCDDMNAVNGDGCDTNCTFTGCGNQILTAGEACDDGDTDETDGCTSACSIGVVCNATAFAGGDRFAVDPLTGSCYVSFDGEQTTFTAARSACTAINGYLTTITNAAEQALVRGVQNPAENPWIGGLDDANTTDATFSWVTAEPFTFTSFDTSEPDNDVALGGNGDCLHLNANGNWADTNCNVATFVTGRVCEIETQPCGDGVLQAGEQCDDGNVTAGDGCTTTCKLERAFFSEYVEGSSNSKALEIKNPFNYPINLQACTLGITFNGNTAVTTFTFPSAPVPANDVFVVCNNTSAAALLGLCDLPTNSSVLTFNGNDAVALSCNGTPLDIIGQIGFNPGTEWGSGLASTADNTLRRKCAVTTGDTVGNDAFVPATEWTGFAVDTFAGLGDPACAP